MKRKYVLSIAGFDPSGGAGILADIKTFEANKVCGLGVISGNTFQNDNEFKSVDWISLDKIIEQTDLLKKRFEIDYVKIGLIEDLQILETLISKLRTPNSQLKIVWDPILKASAGYEFHKGVNKKLLEKICKQLYLITPNVPEALLLSSFKTADENAKHLAQFCNVFLKGGHDAEKVGYDHLYTIEGKQFSFRPKIKTLFEKHGSGCVLSSAITANLARGFKLHEACLRSKQYTARVLQSNKTLLGFHKI